ncbi:cutinase [Moniliophthora roreri]|nr:cutinase [Moniliophthora roreri]
MTTNLDYSQNTYLAITLSSSNPSNIVSLHPALTHVGQVGQLKDVQMFSVPKTVWESNIGDEIKGILEGQKGRDEAYQWKIVEDQVLAGPRTANDSGKAAFLRRNRSLSTPTKDFQQLSRPFMKDLAFSGACTRQ